MQASNTTVQEPKQEFSAKEMPNKYASVSVDKNPIYNALSIGFDAQSGKLPSTDAIRELFGNTRNQLEIEREKLREDPQAWAYN